MCFLWISLDFVGFTMPAWASWIHWLAGWLAGCEGAEDDEEEKKEEDGRMSHTLELGGALRIRKSIK